jgi:hypothetical protein
VRLPGLVLVFATDLFETKTRAGNVKWSTNAEDSVVSYHLQKQADASGYLVSTLVIYESPIQPCVGRLAGAGRTSEVTLGESLKRTMS